MRVGPSGAHLRLVGLFMIFAALAGVGSFIPAMASTRGGQRQATIFGAIEGTVIDKATGAAIVGATVSSTELGIETTTDGEGRFAWKDIPLDSPIVEVNVSASAPSLGDWQIQGVRVLADDTLLLQIELSEEPTTIVVPPPRAEQPEWPEIQGDRKPHAPNLGELSGNTLPTTIRVRVTGYPYCDTGRPYTVEVIDFKEYVKHVLPNEWVPSWPGESLRAGAMAAKMYGWYWVASGGKWSDADVYDSTCDQVYNPAISYESTNQAVEFNWYWRLRRDGLLFQTSYRALHQQCVDAGLEGNCLAQWDTYYHAIGNNGYELLTWDEMLLRYYEGSALSFVGPFPPAGFDLRFYGNGYGDIDRVKIPIDNPARPADVGSDDFTLEWWMKAILSEDDSSPCTAEGGGWTHGNIIFDRDVYGGGDYGEFGISMANGKIAFGVDSGTDSITLCGGLAVTDGAWHHVAVTRRASDGRMRIYVDGELDAEVTGPSGDISYRDGRASAYPDDPYLVIGAEKHDAGPAYPSYSGFLDEIRLSDTIRYDGAFDVPAGPFTPDAETVALYHFDEGLGNTIHDTSGATGGPSDGIRKYGGVINGPEWFVSDLFLPRRIFLPIVGR